MIQPFMYVLQLQEPDYAQKANYMYQVKAPISRIILTAHYGPRTSPLFKEPFILDNYPNPRSVGMDNMVL
jgi:hypothetical protein